MQNPAERRSELRRRSVPARPMLDHKGRVPGSGFRRRHPDGQLYHPGELVRQTGIYEIIHDRAHRVEHEAVMHAGDLFPACETCELRVRFRVIRTAPYIFDDLDFDPSGDA